MKTWNTKDKTNWQRGEWDNEPDKAQWVDETTGLDCLIVRNNSGALCGYVGVPESNPHFEKDYDHEGLDFGVHGGLTFADRCHDTGDEAKDICHSEECAANKIVWWLGFDCAHSGDLTPKYDRDYGFDSTYKNFGYVKDEVTALAGQLAT